MTVTTAHGRENLRRTSQETMGSSKYATTAAIRMGRSTGSRNPRSSTTSKMTKAAMPSITRMDTPVRACQQVFFWKGEGMAGAAEVWVF